VCFTFAVVALVAGCGGHGKETLQKVDLPLFTGWFWHLISFLAIVGVAYLVNQKGEANEDSLFKLGNRLRQLEDRLEELQKSVQPAPKAEPAAAAAPAAAPASPAKAGAKNGKKKDESKPA
jgi:hypothetical protein